MLLMDHSFQITNLVVVTKESNHNFMNVNIRSIDIFIYASLRVHRIVNFCYIYIYIYSSINSHCINLYLNYVLACN
jgi:hypothetical protein